MRIIRGRDYYDSAVAYGGYEENDPVMFVRNHKRYYHDNYKTNTIPRDFPFKLPFIYLEKRSILKYHESGKDNWMWRELNGINPLIVFFAGKIYRGLTNLPSDMAETWSKGNLCDIFTVWSMKGLAAHIEKERTKNKGIARGYSWRADILDIKDISKFEDYFKPVQPSKEELNWVIENKVSIFIMYSNYQTLELIINPVNTKAIDFQKVLTPFEAYQELSMWVGGILAGNENPMVTISDEHKIVKHGFDNKSFRKDPWKRRK